MDNQARWVPSDSLDSSAFPYVHQTKNSAVEEEEEEEETMKKIRRKDRKETETDVER